jgi:hypothetical protein
MGGAVSGGTALTAGGVVVRLTTPLPNPFGPPNSIGDDKFQSPDLFGFNEDRNIPRTAPLAVDVGPSPIPAGDAAFSPAAAGIEHTPEHRPRGRVGPGAGPRQPAQNAPTGSPAAGPPTPTPVDHRVTPEQGYRHDPAHR